MFHIVHSTSVLLYMRQPEDDTGCWNNAEGRSEDLRPEHVIWTRVPSGNKSVVIHSARGLFISVSRIVNLSFALPLCGNTYGTNDIINDSHLIIIIRDSVCVCVCDYSETPPPSRCSLCSQFNCCLLCDWIVWAPLMMLTQPVDDADREPICSRTEGSLEIQLFVHVQKL